MGGGVPASGPMAIYKWATIASFPWLLYSLVAVPHLRTNVKPKMAENAGKHGAMPSILTRTPFLRPPARPTSRQVRRLPQGATEVPADLIYQGGVVGPLLSY